MQMTSTYQVLKTTITTHPLGRDLEVVKDARRISWSIPHTKHACNLSSPAQMIVETGPYRTTQKENIEIFASMTIQLLSLKDKPITKILREPKDLETHTLTKPSPPLDRMSSR